MLEAACVSQAALERGISFDYLSMGSRLLAEYYLWAAKLFRLVDLDPKTIQSLAGCPSGLHAKVVLATDLV